MSLFANLPAHDLAEIESDRPRREALLDVFARHAEPLVRQGLEAELKKSAASEWTETSAAMLADMVDHDLLSRADSEAMMRALTEHLASDEPPADRDVQNFARAFAKSLLGVWLRILGSALRQKTMVDLSASLLPSDISDDNRQDFQRTLSRFPVNEVDVEDMMTEISRELFADGTDHFRLPASIHLNVGARSSLGYPSVLIATHSQEKLDTQDLISLQMRQVAYRCLRTYLPSVMGDEWEAVIQKSVEATPSGVALGRYLLPEDVTPADLYQNVVRVMRQVERNIDSFFTETDTTKILIDAEDYLFASHRDATLIMTVEGRNVGLHRESSGVVIARAEPTLVPCTRDNQIAVRGVIRRAITPDVFSFDSTVSSAVPSGLLAQQAAARH